MITNQIGTYVDTLQFLLGSVWRFFTNTQVPLLGITFAQFWLAVAGVSIMFAVVRFWLFDIAQTTDVSSSGGGRSNHYNIPKNRRNDS